MAIPFSALEAGKCYLTNTGRVWKVLRIMPDGRVQYEHRLARGDTRFWAPGMLITLPAEVEIEREVPWGWTPEADKENA